MNGSKLVQVVRDRCVWLLAVSTAIAVVFGFSKRVVPDDVALAFVWKAGYWLVLVAFGLFVHALWRTFRDELGGLHWRKLDWATVAIIAVGGTVLLVHETFGFKIVMDEIMLLGTSMAMHLDRTVLTPVRGNDVQGAFVILDGMMDKRPLFFPFLASLLHDLTGYRPANLFLLNGGLTFVFLGLVHTLGRLLAGRLAGWLGVVLFAGLPLLGHNATGGGFELLNLVMILATLLLGARFVEKRDSASCAAFCFSALLLAQVRYESVIFLGPVALLVLWVWWREGRAVLAWPVIIAPLLMVHYPLQHRIFDLRASAWELGSRPGSEKVFSTYYLFHGVPPDDHGNLQSALTFFFGPPSDQPSSLVFSVLGFLAVPFFLLLVGKRLRSLTQQPPVSVATTLFALGFVAQFALMMCYFYGQFDNVVIRRLSLPTHLGMAIAVMAVIPQIPDVRVVRTLIGVALFGLIASGVPSMATHAYSQEYLPGKETAWRREFMAQQPRRDYLMIDNDSILWIAHQVTSMPVLQAQKKQQDLVMLMRNHVFSDVYVFQRYEKIDEKTGVMTLRDGDDLGPNFVLETVREERLRTLTLTRISRVKEIREGGKVLTAPDTTAHTVPKSRAEIEKLRRAYLENFIKMLP